MVLHRTSRGIPIDMSALAAKHSHKKAIGNANMNARGDIIDKQGIVLKTQEQIENEWKRMKEKTQESLGISQDIKSPFSIPTPPIKKVIADTHSYEPTILSQPTEAPVKVKKTTDKN